MEASDEEMKIGVARAQASALRNVEQFWTVGMMSRRLKATLATAERQRALQATVV